MSATTRWWWIRHAPVTGHDGRLYGALDVPCDTSDDASFAGLARNLPADAVWVTSHLSRARDTAAAIVAAEDGHLLAAPEPLVEEDFGEQDFGAWQGLAWAEMETYDPAAYRAFWDNPAGSAPPGGESFADLIDRAAAVIARLNAAHAGRDIVAVTHGGTIRAAMAVALDLSPNKAMSVVVDNLSLTRLEFIEGGLLRGHGGQWRISAVNLPPRPLHEMPDRPKRMYER
ncbi:MAG: histidine phosphatase family protein [Hyphomicrobiales bacterium]|nr:histidine phosphatase family protein [Hyphomicrobiales bacterium]MCP5370108.1 histidine phosphatase family protein [Hyphomicrobiales bacterium]